MLRIKREEALKYVKEGRLPNDLVEKGISVIMSRRHANKWLSKLEDGTQRQAKCTLYDKDTKGFCCLGLEQACNWGGKVETDPNLGRPRGLPTYEYLRSTGKMYFDEFGLKWRMPYMGDGKHAADHNDSGMSFKNIAKRLRDRIAIYD